MKELYGWGNFLKVKEHLVDLNLLGADRSKYWEEESSSIEYMVEATPAIISKLRDHCHWLTGVRSYDYKSHHLHKSNALVPKYFALRELDSSLPFYGDVGVLGDFGFEIEGNIVNLDTLKFFESIMALHLSSQLRRLQNMSRPVIVEIGAGWGGYLSMLKQYVPNAQIVIVDLPHTMIFSATYLPTAFPDCSVGFLGSAEFTGLEDFIFMTSEQFPDWKPQKIDLAINMVSFQEMTSTQVEAYGAGLLNKNCSVLYSHNREKSAHNDELVSVDESLSAWPYSTVVDLLDVDYTNLNISMSFEKVQANLMDSGSRMKLLYFLGGVVYKLPRRLRKKINSYIAVGFSEKVKNELFRPQKGLKVAPLSKKGYTHTFYFSDLDLEYLKSIN
jgi:hypothetical protein